MNFFVRTLTQCCNHVGSSIQKVFIAWTKPAKSSLVAGAVSDLAKSKAELMAENALLRKQLIILNRQVKKPTFTSLDRPEIYAAGSTQASFLQPELAYFPQKSFQR